MDLVLSWTLPERNFETINLINGSYPFGVFGITPQDANASADWQEIRVLARQSIYSVKEILESTDRFD